MRVRPLPSPVTSVPHLVLRSGNECEFLWVSYTKPANSSGDAYLARWEDTSFHLVGSLGTSWPAI